MAAAGIEKFSHLEDKIYRALELCKVLKSEKENFYRELSRANQDVSELTSLNEALEKRVEKLIDEREAMRLKVEAMLDAIAMLEMEAESFKK